MSIQGLSYSIFVVLCLVSAQICSQPIVLKNVTLQQEVDIILPNGTVRKTALSIYVLEDKLCMESNTGNRNLKTIYLSKENLVVTITTVNDQQKGTIKENALSFDPNLAFRLTDDMDERFSYPCKKGLIFDLRTEGSEQGRIVWFTSDLKLPFAYNFGVEGLNLIQGFPLEYENILGGVKMIHRVISIDFKSPIDESKFVIPLDLEAPKK